MDKLFLSKSSYCDCIQCNKMFWLNKYKKDLAVVNVNDNILENGRKVGEFATKQAMKRMAKKMKKAKKKRK